jgi:hypothetical protein
MGQSVCCLDLGQSLRTTAVLFMGSRKARWRTVLAVLRTNINCFTCHSLHIAVCGGGGLHFGTEQICTHAVPVLTGLMLRAVTFSTRSAPSKPQKTLKSTDFYEILVPLVAVIVKMWRYSVWKETAASIFRYNTLKIDLSDFSETSINS